MKHFSYFINPGFKRVSATDNDNNVRTSAYLSPDGFRLVVVLINTNATVSSAMSFNFGTFSVGKSSVYQTGQYELLFPVARVVDERPSAAAAFIDDGGAGQNRHRRRGEQPVAGQRRVWRLVEFPVELDAGQQRGDARGLSGNQFQRGRQCHAGVAAISGRRPTNQFLSVGGVLGDDLLLARG